MNDLVSVITPSFNSEAFIVDCISSVQSQTYPSWEMIVVDDASTDNSVDIIRGYAVKDPRIRIHHLPENSGPAVARNTAIEISRGRFIAFLDSDDTWRPQKLEKQIRFMCDCRFPLTYCYYERMTEDGVPTGEIVKPPLRVAYRNMLRSNYIGCLTAAYDRGILGTQLMPLIRKRQDYGLWLRLLKQTPYAYCLPESLALYRVRNDSVSGNKLKLLHYQWRLLRQVERLSLAQSAYSLGWNIALKALGQLRT